MSVVYNFDSLRGELDEAVRSKELRPCVIDGEPHACVYDALEYLSTTTNASKLWKSMEVEHQTLRANTKMFEFRKVCPLPLAPTPLCSVLSCAA